MGLKFNPLVFSGFSLTSSGGGGGNPSYKASVANAASLPTVGNSDGDVRVTLDTDEIWVWENTAARWVNVGLRESLALGSTPNAVGYSLELDDSVANLRTRELELQPADATNPGVVSAVAQDLGGVKTFVDGLDAGSNVIVNVANPVAPQDAATKDYVDDQDALKANTTLNNLTTTSINQDLLPSAANARAVGNPTLHYSTMNARAYNAQTFGSLSSNSPNVPSGPQANWALRSLAPDLFGYSVGVFSETNPTAISNATTGGVFVETGNLTSASVTTGTTGAINIKTGNHAGSAGTGGINIETGTPTSGSRGQISFKDGTQGTAGHVWTSTDVNGQGAWAPPTLLYFTTTVDYTDFSVASPSGIISNLITLPVGSVVTFTFWRTTTAWTGGAIASVFGSLGTSAVPTALYNVDMFSAPGPTNYTANPQAVYAASFASTYNDPIQIDFVVDADQNLNTLVAGEGEIIIGYYVIPVIV